jgi:hypothetical protein
MAKKDKVEVEAPVEVTQPVEVKVHPLVHEFTHGDFNLLKDKLNEVIKVINK